MLGSLILSESNDKSGEAGFMVFIVEPGLMSTPKGNFHGKFQEAIVRASLKTHTYNNLAVLSAGLVF
jgi:hypothetical protein